MPKYTTKNLLPALRLFVKARNRAIKAGFTDNGGAIHSVERIVDILSCSLCYPDLKHINKLKSDPKAEISKAAHKARQRGETLKIEHVMPQRAYSRKIIEIITNGGSNEDVIRFIKENYRLVLLTAEETSLINKINMSKITKDRIADAGIQLYKGS